MLSTIFSYLQPDICGARPKKLKSKPKYQTFHLFPFLPAELRFRIWALALYQDPQDFLPRQIALYRCAPHATRSFFKISLSRKYPVLFAVNREARYEASRLLGGEWVDINRGWMGMRETVRVHVRFERDTVLLRGCGGLLTKGEEGVMWNGHVVEPWECGGDVGNREPIYVAGVKMKKFNFDGENEGRLAS